MARRADAGTEQRTVLATRVVGRERELAELRATLDGARDGRGCVLFLAGEAGIGKSRLAAAAVAQAEDQGLTVLRGRAVPTSAPVPYRPLAEALTVAERAGLAPETEALVPFRPVLARLVADWHDSEAGGFDDSVVVLAEGVLRFLRAVAGGRGCVVVLEDLHWADAETLAIVEYLADHLGGERVLIVATVRDEQPSAAIDLARALRARRASALLELGRLDGGQVTAMLRSCLGTERVDPEVEVLARRADGVPFLVEELLAVAVSSGALVRQAAGWSLSAAVGASVPLTFADSVHRRLATLPDQARRVVAAAAVLGRRFDWDLLPDAAGVDEEAVVAALRTAVDVQLIEVEGAGGAFRFRHALSRDAVLAGMLPPERARLSERALESIERAHPGLPGEWCELAAGIAEGAGDRSRAAALLVEAGRRSLQAGALATAEAGLERALAAAPPGDPAEVDAQECLARVLALAGKRDRAVEVGEGLLRRWGDDPSLSARRAEIDLGLARAAVAAARWNEADERIARASEEAAAVMDDPLRARLAVIASQVAILRHPEEAVALATTALEVAERIGLTEVACEALEVIGRHARARDLDAGEAAFARGLALAEARGLAVWRMRALHEMGTIELLRDGGTARLERAREASLQLGAPRAPGRGGGRAPPGWGAPRPPGRGPRPDRLGDVHARRPRARR